MAVEQAGGGHKPDRGGPDRVAALCRFVSLLVGIIIGVPGSSIGNFRKNNIHYVYVNGKPAMPAGRCPNEPERHLYYLAADPAF